jgi:Anti-sigma-28 factor, FlgM
MPMQGSYPMDEDREATLVEIKDRIEQGKYRIDARAVADAIVRQLGEIARASAERVTPCERTVEPGAR